MAPRQAKDEPRYLYVRSNLDPERGGDPVALHEIDDAHPGGSAIVSGLNPVKVGNTAMVKMRLREGWLVETNAAADKKAADKRAEKREQMVGATPPEVVAGEMRREEASAPGADPTDEELAEKGLTREQFEAERQKELEAQAKRDEKQK